MKAETQENQQQEMLEYKIKYDNYIADMHWVVGNGRTFKEYPRWHEVIAPKKPLDENAPKLTKEIMMQHIRSLKSK